MFCYVTDKMYARNVGVLIWVVAYNHWAFFAGGELPCEKLGDAYQKS